MEQTLQMVKLLKTSGHEVISYSIGEIWYINKDDNKTHHIYNQKLKK